jgi:hypothetical protein
LSFSFRKGRAAPTEVQSFDHFDLGSRLVAASTPLDSCSAVVSSWGRYKYICTFGSPLTTGVINLNTQHRQRSSVVSETSGDAEKNQALLNQNKTKKKSFENFYYLLGTAGGIMGSGTINSRGFVDGERVAPYLVQDD